MKYGSCILLLALLACNNHEDRDNNMDGGPCVYHYDTLPAVVTAIPKVDSNRYDIVFRVAEVNNIDAHIDSISYYVEKHAYFSAEELKNKQVNLNDSFIYVQGQMISGSCNPDHSFLLMEKYHQ